MSEFVCVSVPVSQLGHQKGNDCDMIKGSNITQLVVLTSFAFRDGSTQEEGVEKRLSESLARVADWRGKREGGEVGVGIVRSKG